MLRLLQNPLAHTAKAAAAAFGELLTVAQLQEETALPSADDNGGMLEEVTRQLLALGIPPAAITSSRVYT